MEKDIATSGVLGWLKETAEKGADFVETQAPLLANEIVAWHFWSCVTQAVMFASIATAAAFGVRWAFKVFETTKEGHPRFGFAIVVMIVSTVCLIVPPIAFSIASYEAVKAAVAPRIVIIQYLSNHGRR